MNRTHVFARLFALLFALVLAGFPLGTVALEGLPATSARIAIGSTDPLDLPAMTLMPTDLDKAGFDGLGLTYGGLDTLDFVAQRIAEIRGGATTENSAQYARLLWDAGWQRTLENFYAMPRTDDPNELVQRLRSVVTQYADDDGASRAFAVLTDADEITAFTVEDVPWSDDGEPGGSIDEAVLWRYDGVRKTTGARFHSLELNFRFANLTISLALDNFGTRQPDVAAIESLAGALLRRIETVKESDAPGLSASALRFALPTDTPSYDNYARLDGEGVRYFGESPSAAKGRVANYPDVPDIYVVYQTIAAGEPDPADDILFRSYIFHFDNESEASAWMNEGAEGDDLLDDAPTFGDESWACACQPTGADAADRHGFLVVIRVGARVAVFNLLATWNISLAAFTDVAQVQASCLADGDCLQPAPIPNTLQTRVGADPSSVERRPESVMSQLFPTTIAPENGRD